MKDIIALLIAFIGGLVTGFFFFGGLWWTIRKGAKSLRPALLFLASYLLRFAVVGVLIFLLRDHTKWLLVGLIGFIGARGFLIRKFSTNQGKKSVGEILHAPQP